MSDPRPYVRIYNPTLSTVSIDARFGDKRQIRERLLPDETVDVTALVTSDELRRNPEILDLVERGLIELQTESADNTSIAQHIPIVEVGRGSFFGMALPGNTDNLGYQLFTVGSDNMYRTFKIPSTFTGNPSAHIHWTKSQDTDQSGNRVLWRIHYKVFDGRTQEASGAGSMVEFEDIYEDSGTTTRIVYRTDDLELSGFIPSYYVAFRIEAVTPSQDTLAEPALVSLDLIWDELINRGPIT